MSKDHDSYSVVVLPRGMAEPLRFSIKKRTCQYLIGLSIIVSLAVVGSFAQYILMLDRMQELRNLRKETKLQEIQIRSVLHVVDRIKQQMTRLAEVDRKLRVMTDLGVRKDPAALMGVGGPEEGEASRPKLMSAIQFDLGALRTKVLQQEESFDELVEAVLKRQSLLAATPSTWPASGSVVSGFGKRISPFTGRLVMHNGIDIGAPHGALVVAPAAGIVTYVGYDSGYGKIIKINHGHGIVTYYGHLSTTMVAKSQKVKRGEKIALVGNTGMSTGSHLHYEVYLNNAPVDPMRYILRETS